MFKQAYSKSILEIKAAESLNHLGVPANIKGHAYLLTAIVMVLSDHEYLSMITKRLYPTIAKEFNTTSYCVERNIRRCIEITWKRSSPYTISKYFGHHSMFKKPTNSEFIAGIANNIKLNLKIDMLKTV